MLRRLALAAVLIAGLPTALAAADPVGDRVAGVQRVAEQGAADTAAACRRAGASCPVPLAPAVSEQAIADYQRSPLHRTLAFQYALGNSLPLLRAPWIGTHNSFNTTAEPATLSELDSNQQLSLTDQLRIDVRSLELDAHWFPSARAGGRNAAVLCHGESENMAHAGCTTERLLVDGLTEISTWLTAHPREVVLLYLEDHLVVDDGFAAAAAAIRSALGSRVYAPGGTGCTALPLALTRDQVRRAGKQVVIMSTCHAGAGWNGQVFDDAERAKHEIGPEGYGNGTCDPAHPAAKVDGLLQRVYEDSTAVTANTSPPAHRISPGQAHALALCAVDLIGFDQILPDDGRLAALAWTWAPSQPASGSCASQGADGRWRTGACGQALACVGPHGWYVAPGSCRGGTWSVPRYGWEAVQLGAAMKRAGVTSARLALVRSGSTWVSRAG
jgi:hypothetical protein